MFAQTDNDNWKNDIECYKCGKKGHFAWECTNKKTKEAEQMHATIAEEEGQDLEQGENIFVQNGGTRGGVNPSYVLLDNQSTESFGKHQENQESDHRSLQQRIVIHKPRRRSR